MDLIAINSLGEQQPAGGEEWVVSVMWSNNGETGEVTPVTITDEGLGGGVFPFRVLFFPYVFCLFTTLTTGFGRYEFSFVPDSSGNYSLEIRYKVRNERGVTLIFVLTWWCFRSD